MKKKNYYMIDGCDETFDTLREIRNHVWLANGEGFDGRIVYQMLDDWPHKARQICWDGKKATLKMI